MDNAKNLGNMSHCEMLEKAADMLAEVSDILDKLSAFRFVEEDQAWGEKMTQMATDTCCMATDVAELFGKVYIYTKRGEVWL